MSNFVYDVEVVDLFHNVVSYKSVKFKDLKKYLPHLETCTRNINILHQPLSEKIEETEEEYKQRVWFK
jgi:hypothetical protein